MSSVNDFLLQSRITVETAKSAASTTPTLHVVLESDLAIFEPAKVGFAKKIYGDLKAKNVYIASDDGLQFLLIVSKENFKKLGQNPVGDAHIVTNWGGFVAATLQTSALEKRDALFVKASQGASTIIVPHAEHFTLAILQRSVSNKVATKAYQERLKNECVVTIDETLCSDEKLKKARNLHEAMLVTRSLINMPPNVLNPLSYATFVSSLLHSHQHFKSLKKVTIEIIDNQKLVDMGCGLITAVGKGSVIPPCVVKLSYNPTATKHIALVGKGVTFDSGGLDIKASAPMRNMKKDMGGSASALGSFLAIASLELPIQVSCYLALAENMVSGNAMRPGDVYIAKNGLSVEIDNTDAEGRLVLADTMCLALEQKPDWLIDLATLTGAARIALGPQVDAMFTNDHKVAETLTEIGISLGDWVWEMPLVDDYDSMFDSAVAEFTNCSTSGLGGAITAAQFLKKFVSNNTKWTHIDTYMWNDKASDLYAENGASAKCVRLVTWAAEHFGKSAL